MRSRLAVIAIGLILSASGCVEPKPPEAGSTSSSVEERLGKPDEIAKPPSATFVHHSAACAAGTPSELWIYRRTMRPSTVVVFDRSSLVICAYNAYLGDGAYN